MFVVVRVDPSGLSYSVTDEPSAKKLVLIFVMEPSAAFDSLRMFLPSALFRVRVYDPSAWVT